MSREEGPAHGMTPRALATGLVLSLAVGIAVYFEMYLKGSNAGGVFFTSPAALFFFFILVGIVNVVLGALHRPWAFRRGELIAIFIMMTVANSAHNPVHYWLGALTGVFYYATPENDWVERLHPHIPEWIAPRDWTAIRDFYEGTGAHGGIPWEVWVGPILYWLPLIMGFHVAALCLMVVVRRQWMDQERLVYPVIQVPLAMVQDDERGSLIKPFFRSWVMWLGMAVPMAIGAVRGLHHYLAYVPSIELHTQLPLMDGLSVPMRLSFATLGFFFLIIREVSFSLWALFLLNLIQKAVYLRLGIGTTMETAISPFSRWSSPDLVHQGVGGLIVLVLGGLWLGRRHIADVLRKAFTGARDIDDSREILSYRGAVFGLFGSFAVMTVWLWLSGIPLLGVLVFLFFAFVIFLGLTRLVAEGGVAVIYNPLVAPDAAVSAMGSSFFGASGIMGLMFTRVWANDIMNFIMPHFANGLKLSEQIGRRRSLLFWGMILASLAGLSGSLWMVLTLTYNHGGVNLRDFNYIWMPRTIPEYAAARIGEWSGPAWWGWFHTGVGAVFMSMLMMARRFWGWWPLHPIGFPISACMGWVATNAFLAWMFKSIALNYGGPPLYRAIRPFFLGLILGQIAICGIWWIVDTISGQQGNYVLL